MKKVFSLAGAMMLAAMSAAAQTPAQQPSTQKPVTFGQPQQGAPAQTLPREMTHPAPFQPKASGALAQIQGFNIVLLVGESQSSGPSIDDVPPAARKALTDMRDFLPFKHYRVLDSQWTSCCGDGMTAQIRGNVQGVRGYGMSADGSSLKLAAHPYVFSLHVAPTGSSRLSVTFRLEEPQSEGQNLANYAGSREQLEKRLADLRKEHDTLEDEIPHRRQRLGDKHPESIALQQQMLRVQQRIAEAVNHLAATSHESRQGSRRAVIDSNFTMDLGETVVVGTSRIGGDKALIAIVTAVRRGSR